MADSTHDAIRRINLEVTGETVAERHEHVAKLPQRTAASMAAQSMAQSLAIAVGDASDMLRNVETIMTTTQGVAMAHWLEQPSVAEYEQILHAATGAIAEAARLWQDIARSAKDLLVTLPTDDASPTLPLPHCSTASASKPAVTLPRSKASPSRSDSAPVALGSGSSRAATTID